MDDPGTADVYFGTCPATEDLGAGLCEHVAPMAQRPRHREIGLDLWLALLAGDRAWRDGSGHAAPREQSVGAFLVLALVATLVGQWIALTSRIVVTDGLVDSERILIVAAVVSLAAVAVLTVRPARLARGKEVAHAPFAWSVAWRGAAYLLLITCSAGFLVRFRFLAAIPLGLVAGADILLALWTLGSTPRPLRWLRRFLFSTLHFGVLGALLGTAMLEPDRATNLLSLYAAMWLGLIVAGGTIVALDRLTALADAQRLADGEAIRARERAYRAHWLHDDVLSEVRIATLRMGHDPSTEHARRELLELDHRLRLRQLDEMMRGGTAHIYEVLQPHLRRAQALGVRLGSVPSLEVTGRTVAEETARLVNRVVSVVTSNAINAGATELSIDLVGGGGDLMTLTVVDDAGGFDPTTIPAGRGLDTLRRDLGTDLVSVTPAGRGSSVSVTFPAPPATAGATPTLDALPTGGSA